jgi:tRNA threonylcarbamoyladenosine biosynthesis protein TsaE
MPNMTSSPPTLPGTWRSWLPSLEATREAGLVLGRALPRQALVLMQGEMGAGKTTLIKAICEAIGIPPAVVISPTYTLVNVYPGAPAVYHVDLFRLEGPDALLDLDERDWINPDGPTFLEWPEFAAPLLAGRPALRIQLALEGAGRRIEVATEGPGAEAVYAPVLLALHALPQPF